jgi:hypothetical protein
MISQRHLFLGERLPSQCRVTGLPGPLTTRRFAAPSASQPHRRRQTRTPGMETQLVSVFEQRFGGQWTP